MYGEQMVVVLDNENKAWLYHGDYGWDKKVEIIMKDGTTPEIVMHKEEYLFVELCWENIRKIVKHRLKEKSE